MHSSIKILAVFFAINIVLSTALADEPKFGGSEGGPNVSTNDPGIPASIWEQHPEGVSLALTLVTKTEKGAQKGSIKVYLKNTTQTEKAIAIHGGNLGIKIFYVDNQGTQVPLRDYNKDDLMLSGLNMALSFKNGEILTCTVELTSDELTLVQSHPVKCSIPLSEVGKHYVIESTPRQLVAVAGQ